MTLRETLWLRCNGYCERCGLRLDNSWAMHHRKLKSRGGKDEITNVLALHHHCHNLGTHSVHLAPDLATKQGYLVASWDDSKEVVVTLGDGSKVLLTDDGTYKHLEDGNGW
jgi:hypothetical protein